MIIDWILAGLALGVTFARPRSWTAAFAVVALAGISVAAGSGALGGAVAATWPMIVFLFVAVLAAAGAVRLGLATWAAGRLARAARGRPLVLYTLVCLATALATAVVSLDGAVVLLVPVALELRARFGASLRPLLLAIVAVANAFSLGLPEGNPTNLVVLARLGGGLGAYVVHALPAAVVAATMCAVGVAVLERRRLRMTSATVSQPAAVRAGAGLGSVLRLGLQLTALLVLLIPVAARVPMPAGGGLVETLAIAGVTAAAAGLLNNLPAAAAVAAALGGPAAYAALAGLSVGALATEHGSVATLLAGDLAGTSAYTRRLVPVAALALGAAATLIWLAG